MESSLEKRDVAAKGKRNGILSDLLCSSVLQGEGHNPNLFVFENASLSASASDRTGDNRFSKATGIQPDIQLDSSGIASPSSFGENLGSARITYAISDEGHAVITGRDLELHRCEDEPIHTPGAIQGFGLLVGLREEFDGRFSVRVASENSGRIVRYSPQELFSLNSFLDVFKEEEADKIRYRIRSIRNEDSNPVTNEPAVFSISMQQPRDKSIKLWCAIYIASSHSNLIICEFELQDDCDHPLRPSDEMKPSPPKNTPNQDLAVQESNKEIEVLRQHLIDLRNPRKEIDAMDTIDLVSQIEQSLGSAPNLDVFLEIVVDIVKELTGFHRVMIYQFDSSLNGKVITEVADLAYSQNLYKGLCFPASDIPKQARELYKINKVRLLYNRDLESARLVYRSVEDAKQPLDLTHSYLRALSPFHRKYVTNMAVRASLSISITASNELWGLITCHTYGPHGMRVAFPIRKICRLVGDIASRNLERLSYVSRLEARNLINTIPNDNNPTGNIISSSKELLKLFDANSGMLYVLGETSIMGQPEDSQEVLAVLEYLRIKKFTSVITTQNIGNDFPELRYPPGFSTVAGLLYVPLSSDGQDFIVFLRKGQVVEVKWAGNPYKNVINEGTSKLLEPRPSFEVWHEVDSSKCKEWSSEQIETAAVLCLVYGKFLEIWKQKETAVRLSRQTQLLLANSAHELRTPLNAIINCLEIALEDNLDEETRDNIVKSRSASKSLICVINDLLDLTKTEEGQELIKDEIFNLMACIKEATEPFTDVAKRKTIDYEIIEHPSLPRLVRGDQRRVRQIITNLVENAFQFTSQGRIKVECYAAEIINFRVKFEVAVQDTGRGMSYQQLDALFRDFEQVSLHADESSNGDKVGKSGDNRTMGLGLAIVARIIQNMGGQLRVKSKEGKGSRFVLQLPLGLVNNAANDNASTNDIILGAQPSAATTTNTPHPKESGEVTLVDRRSPIMMTNANLDHALAMPNGTSIIGSPVCGVRKDTDGERLLDAIQNSYPVGDPMFQEIRQQRQVPKTSSKSLLCGESITSNVPQPENSDRRPFSTGSKHSQSGRCTTKSPTDTQTPMGYVRAPHKYHDKPTLLPSTVTSSYTNASASTSTGGKLHVLVAEDDPINMMIIRKRLETAGHAVSATANGEDCARVYIDKPQDFDVILMDIQMPIVDGLKSTKIIRAFEKSEECFGLSSLAQHQGRVPIIAVSASLAESEKAVYINAGFDGWILKPINFKRLNVLLTGMFDDDTRSNCLYVKGEWERGGWFASRCNILSHGLEVSKASSSDFKSTSLVLKQSEAGT
ncbi:uncharacterized protein BCR38DRAFT_329196 [Pseudomassariella vexata]|uniref:Uncharacterized protein n=1 Tax=Pseudomassariella vexata TaxID=1141098 RepID=A0A1Y2EHX9_9PEZI|nr:uncharacterized protein BCR38DRAFT_329196 [Pseudomassariella vexata]ORY71179.1 hypothetical protein BCR38DRAFT_329196 [Pseudomassariella vexata]